MDKAVRNYPKVPFGELEYCYEQGIMFQRDSTPSVPYDDSYFQHYADLEGNEVADRLNAGRVSLSHKYCDTLLDVGVGSGEFIKKSTARMYGYDINPAGVKWLLDRKIYADPYTDLPEDVEGVTLWDTLEHLSHPSQLLSKLRPGTYAFVSLPIFTDLTAVRASKHYKPGEHLWYFTSAGLVRYMADCGFGLVEISDHEVRAGRESILAFAFVRRSGTG